MAKIATLSTMSPSTPERMPAAIRVQMITLLNWPTNIQSKPMRLLSFNSFRPSTASRFAASCADSPVAEEPSCTSTSFADWLCQA